jgi:hypothetical protein
MKVKFGATALRWVSDEPQPGLIEVAINGVNGIEHRIIEKNLVIAPFDIWADAPFPVDFDIEAEAEPLNDSMVRVTLPWFMETTEGETQLLLSKAAIEVM